MRGGWRAGGEGGGRGAATRRNRAAARGRGRAGGSPPDRRTGTDRRPGAAAAGRPEACESDFPAVSPKRIRFFLFLSLSFFLNFKAFSGFFFFFFFFCLQATRPESGGSCGDPGRREAARGATAPFIPARPGRCWSKGASRPGRSRARPLGPGARGGAATRERPGAAAWRHSDPWRSEDRSAGASAGPKRRFPYGRLECKPPARL